MAHRTILTAPDPKLKAVGKDVEIVDGDDPDWASWYADWLLDLSELPTLLGRTPIRSHLIHALVQLDRDYTKAKPSEPWESWYAKSLTAHV